jgi:hypothetical protein
MQLQLNIQVTCLQLGRKEICGAMFVFLLSPLLPRFLFWRLILKFGSLCVCFFFYLTESGHKLTRQSQISLNWVVLVCFVFCIFRIKGCSWGLPSAREAVLRGSSGSPSAPGRPYRLRFAEGSIRRQSTGYHLGLVTTETYSLCYPHPQNTSYSV